MCININTATQDHINWLAYGVNARDHCTQLKGQIPSFNIKMWSRRFGQYMADLCASQIWMQDKMRMVVLRDGRVDVKLILDTDYFCRRSSSSSSSSFSSFSSSSSDLFIYLIFFLLFDLFPIDFLIEYHCNSSYLK